MKIPYSKLVSYVDLVTGNTNPRKYEITRITIHHAAGVIKNMSGFSSILRSGRQVSWNYGITNDGKIGIFVDENRRAWTSSSPDNDHRAITIEVSNSSTGGNWPVSAAAYTALVNLCEDICRRYKIKKLTYTGTLKGSNVTLHQWFKATTCPGPYLKSKIPDLVKTVNTRLGAPDTLPYITTGSSETAYDIAVSGSNKSFITADDIDHSYFDPYIITLNRNSSTPNYTKLKELGVSCAMIEAGYLYDSNHVQRSTFKNPKLDAQISEVELANLPYALYTITRAKSVAEARKELQELALWVFRYPPKLGVWVELNLTDYKSINNSIVDVYQEQMIKWGLKNKIGFYVTSSQLNQIDWSKYSQDWYLWLKKPVDSLVDLNDLLTPHFFVL